MPDISPVVTSTAPTTSAPAARPSPRSFGSTGNAIAIAASPIGRLMKKIQCQLRASVRTPPRTWPIDAPAAPVKLKIAIALARSFESVNKVTRMPRPTAEAIALPTPCRKRAAISTAGVLGDAGQQRGGGEHRGAGQEHALAAEQVAEPPGQQQQAAERDQVGVDDPAEAGGGEAEIRLDGRHRDGHDAAVEDRHQQPGRDHSQREPTRRGAGRSGWNRHLVLLSIQATEGR